MSAKLSKLPAFGLPRCAGEEALKWFDLDVPPPLPPRKHSPEEIEGMLQKEERLAERRAKMDEVIDGCLEILNGWQEMGVQLAAEEEKRAVREKRARRRNAAVFDFCVELAALKEAETAAKKAS